MYKDAFEYPVNWEQVKLYRLANLICKSRNLQHQQDKINPQICVYKKCHKSGRYVTQIPSIKFCQSQRVFRKRFRIYGPNNIIYLGIIDRLTVAMIFFCILIAMPLIALNKTGENCLHNLSCKSQGFLYQLSIYNYLGNLNRQQFHQVIIWFIVCIILCIFVIYLKIYVIKMYQKINNKNITQGDFSIILRRVPQKANINDIKLFIKQNLIPYIVQTNQNQYKQNEIQDMLRVQNIILLSKMKQTMKIYQQETERFKQSINNNEYQQFKLRKIPYPTQFSGTALIIFNSIKANDLVQSVIHRPFKQNFIQYLFPFISPRTQFKICGQNISIFRAPEPSDILWRNLGYSQSYRFLMKLKYSILAIFILLISEGVSYSIGIFTIKYKQQHWYSYISVLLSLAVFIFNLILKKLFQYATQRQKLDTETNLLVERLYITVMHQSINLGIFTILIPFLIKIPNFVQGLKSADLPTVMVTMIAFKTIVSVNLNFLYEFYEIKSKFYYYLNKLGYIKLTQYEANCKFSGIQIKLSTKCADSIQLFWFGLIFGIVSPLCIPIAAIGLIFITFHQRVLFSSKYKIPNYGGIRYHSAFVHVLSCTPLIIGLTNLFFYTIYYKINQKSFDKTSLTLIIIIIILGFILFLLPWTKILDRLDYNINSIYTQQHSNVQFQRTYQNENPANYSKIIPKIQQKMEETIEKMKQNKNDIESNNIGTERYLNN